MKLFLSSKKHTFLNLFNLKKKVKMLLRSSSSDKMWNGKWEMGGFKFESL